MGLSFNAQNAQAQEHKCKVREIGTFANAAIMETLEEDTDFIRELCQWAGLPPSAVAKRANLAATTLTRPYNGQATTRMSLSTRERLKRTFPDFPGFQSARSVPDLPKATNEELVYVRQVDISYSMGDGAIVEDYPDVGWIPFNHNFLRAITRANTDHLFIAKGHGDSMEPTLLRSDMLMVDTSQNRIAQQDQIWAISYAGTGMIKRVRRINGPSGDEVVIMSDNPLVPPQTAPLEEVFIVGKVIWIGRSM